MEVYDFGLRLKELRKKRGYTQGQAANHIGVAKQTIGRYERNLQIPNIEIIKSLAVLYRTSADYLLDLPDRPCIYLDDVHATFHSLIIETVEAMKKNLNRTGNP